MCSVGVELFELLIQEFLVGSGVTIEVTSVLVILLLGGIELTVLKELSVDVLLGDRLEAPEALRLLGIYVHIVNLRRLDQLLKKFL